MADGRFKDISDKVFGRLTVLSVAGKNGAGLYIWNCRCSCGTLCVIAGSNLRRGNTKSCGCLQSETVTTRLTSHNLSRSSEYASWASMKTRCLNTKHKDYPYYGGRGISICDRWVDSFQDFLEDMGKKINKGDSLDRINPNGDYCKENCRWATKEMQRFNQRRLTSNTSGRVGVRRRRNGWYVSICNKYIGDFKSFDDAVAAREKAELEKFGFIKSGEDYVKEL